MLDSTPHYELGLVNFSPTKQNSEFDAHYLRFSERLSARPVDARWSAVGGSSRSLDWDPMDSRRVHWKGMDAVYIQTR